MAKFKVLSMVQFVLTHFGMYPQSLLGENNIFKTLLGYHLIFVICALFITSSSLFVYQNYRQFELALETSLIVIAGFQIGGMLLSVRSRMKEIKGLHLLLQSMVDKANDEITEIYWTCEQKARTAHKYIYIYLTSELIVYSTCLLASFYWISVGDLDTESWTVTYNLVLPFSRRGIVKWYVHWFIRFNMGMTYTACTTSTTAYFVACCLYICAICDHFDITMRSTGDDLEFLKNEPNPAKSIQRMNKLKEKLFEAIEIHITIFDMVKTVATINGLAIFSLLPLNAVFFAMSLYNMENSPFDPVSAGFRWLCIMCSLAWPSLYCYYASVVTDRISFIGDGVYNLNWYDYPMHMRKMLILIIVRSQRPTYFTGFDLVRCTLETFGRLFKSSCSYYIIFRSITQR